MENVVAIETDSKNTKEIFYSSRSLAQQVCCRPLLSSVAERFLTSSALMGASVPTYLPTSLLSNSIHLFTPPPSSTTRSWRSTACGSFISSHGSEASPQRMTRERGRRRRASLPRAPARRLATTEPATADGPVMERSCLTLPSVSGNNQVSIMHLMVA